MRGLFISVACIRKRMICSKTVWNDKNFIRTHLSQEKTVWEMVTWSNHVLNQGTAKDSDISICWKTYSKVLKKKNGQNHPSGELSTVWHLKYKRNVSPRSLCKYTFIEASKNAIKDKDRERQFNDKVSKIKVLLNYSGDFCGVHRESKVVFSSLVLAGCCSKKKKLYWRGWKVFF